MFNDKKIIFIVFVFLVLATGGYFYVREKKPENLNNLSVSQTETIRAKTEKFINENLVAPGTAAQITAITQESDIYKVLVKVGDQELIGYVSQDGKNFFPQAFDMDKSIKQEAPPAEEIPRTDEIEPTPEASPKQAAQPTPEPKIDQKDVPSVDLFVMSHCPYGLQIEKGILPVLDLLGSKINFTLKFVDYAMHGDKEIKENLRQYCIQRQGLGFLKEYLKCFGATGDTKACLGVAKIDSAALASCEKATDAEFQITQKAKDQVLWRGGQFPPFDIYAADNASYGVSGSPALIVNRAKVSSPRDPQSLLNIICAAFLKQPVECGQQLSSATPVAGFGEGTASGSNPTSGCGH